ncbi:hypothetical protein [Blastopirellula marina]|uniref:Uncharacterized protein n=1 Tax=Blastopirellula marina TaxID=124 RepID=A0A2S8F4E2_9BACT|nr:hypothetical protein [Blastopirellula marina]PQO27021.1 hypothetical protein C5Y98_27575 [Blastopirellula marina]PTL41168.1 hypothetical protein C5Y97_27590 [Blastopirellula marina]
MTSDQEPQPSILRGQFPLWVLLFVLPTLIAIGCAVYLAFAAQAKAQARLQDQEARIRQDLVAAQQRLARLNRLNASLEIKQLQWKSPFSIVQMVKNPPPKAPNTQSVFTWESLYLVHHSIHFYLQASDEDLRQLVDQLIALYPESRPEVQYRVLDCLEKLPLYMADRIEVVRNDIEDFIATLPEDSDPRIQEVVGRLKSRYPIDESKEAPTR